jgi:hypothetical protein
VFGPDDVPRGQSWGDLSAEVSFVAPTLSTQGTGTYRVVVRRLDNTVAGGQYLLTLARMPGTFIVPAGDEGGPMVNGGNYTGNILRGDLDMWSFSAASGNAIIVSASEVGENTPFVPNIRVYGPNGVLRGQSWGDLRAEVSFVAPTLSAEGTGTYTVVVSRLDTTDGNGQYVLTLARAPGTFIVPAGDEGGPMVNGDGYTGNIRRRTQGSKLG